MKNKANRNKRTRTNPYPTRNRSRQQTPPSNPIPLPQQPPAPPPFIIHNPDNPDHIEELRRIIDAHLLRYHDPFIQDLLTLINQHFSGPRQEELLFQSLNHRHPGITPLKFHLILYSDDNPIVALLQSRI